MLLNVLSYVISVKSDRAHSSYLHRDTMNGLLVSTCFSSNERAEFVTKVVVSVNYRSLEASVVSELHLLTRNAGALGDDLSYGEVTDLEVLELLLGTYFVIQSSVKDEFNHTYEVLVLSYEVGLALHANDSAEVVFYFSEYATFRSLTVATFCCDSLSTLAEQVLRYLKIAVSLFESLLYVHHTCTGNIAQFFDIS